jgi:hypothetical protein
MELYRRPAPWGLELSGFGRPMGLGRDAQGCWLVTDMDCHVLWRLDAAIERFQWHAGTAEGWSGWQGVRPGIATERPKRPPGGFDGPHSVCEDAGGQLIVTCYYTPRIFALSPDGGLRQLAGDGLLRGPATTRLDTAGRLLVAEYALNQLLVLDGSGACLRRIAHDFDRLHMAVAAPDGGLLVADTWNNRLQRFDAQGNFQGFLAPLVDRPVALDLDAQGRMLVTCWGSEEVRLFSPEGAALPLPPLPPLAKPYDARFTPQGIVVADTHHGRLLVVDNSAP